MKLKRDIKKVEYTLKIILIMLAIIGIVGISWVVGRYSTGRCEDKGSIYQPAVCVNKSK